MECEATARYVRMNMPILKHIKITQINQNLDRNSTILQLIKFNAPSKMDYATNYYYCRNPLSEIISRQRFFADLFETTVKQLHFYKLPLRKERFDRFKGPI